MEHVMVRPHGLSQPERIGVGLDEVGFGHGFVSQLVVNAAPGDRAVTRVLNVDGALRHAVDQAEAGFPAGLFQGFRTPGIVAAPPGPSPGRILPLAVRTSPRAVSSSRWCLG